MVGNGIKNKFDTLREKTVLPLALLQDYKDLEMALREGALERASTKLESYFWRYNDPKNAGAPGILGLEALTNPTSHKQENISMENVATHHLKENTRYD